MLSRRDGFGGPWRRGPCLLARGGHLRRFGRRPEGLWLRGRVRRLGRGGRVVERRGLRRRGRGDVPGRGGRRLLLALEWRWRERGGRRRLVGGHLVLGLRRWRLRGARDGLLGGLLRPTPRCKRPLSRGAHLVLDLRPPCRIHRALLDRLPAQYE